MNQKLFLSAYALAAVLTACNKNENAVTDRVELPGNVDNEAFAANIESISVMLAQGKSSAFFLWMHLSYFSTHSMRSKRPSV